MTNQAVFEEDGWRAMEERKLGKQTVVHDLNANRAIMLIDGVVVLPIGAEIELTNPNINVTVEGVRLLAGSLTNLDEVVVCLDVKVPEEYYDPNTA
jgi:hypothetical protein